MATISGFLSDSHTRGYFSLEYCRMQLFSSTMTFLPITLYASAHAKNSWFIRLGNGKNEDENKKFKISYGM